MTMPEQQFDDIEHAALAKMTEVERAQYMLHKRQLAAQEEANRIAGASHRIAENADAPVAEKLRQVDEQRTVLAANRRSAQVQVECPIELLNVPDAPVATVRVTLLGQVHGEQEPGYEGKSLHQRFEVTSAMGWDFAEVDKILVEHIALVLGFKEAKETAARNGNKTALEDFDKLIHGSRKAEGLLHRRWAEAHAPLSRKLMMRTLANLVERGACRLLSDVQVSDTVPR